MVVAQVTQASIAAKNATTRIPIVMIAVSDPVASGLVASLGRPGGNITGTSAGVGGVAGKQLELLRELMPGIARVAVLWNPANLTFQQQQLKETKDAAAALHLQLQLTGARLDGDLEPAFGAIAEGKPPALLVLSDPVYVTHARRVAELALKYRLPSVSGNPDPQLCYRPRSRAGPAARTHGAGRQGDRLNCAVRPRVGPRVNRGVAPATP